MTTHEHGASAGDGTRAAARLLEIAARNADELLDEARTEATSIVTAAAQALASGLDWAFAGAGMFALVGAAAVSAFIRRDHA